MHTNNKRNQYRTCDGCGKQRRDIRSCGRDSNGDADAPDLCFICRVENIKGKLYDNKRQKYVHYYDM